MSDQKQVRIRIVLDNGLTVSGVVPAGTIETMMRDPDDLSRPLPSGPGSVETRVCVLPPAQVLQWEVSPP